MPSAGATNFTMHFAMTVSALPLLLGRRANPEFAYLSLGSAARRKQTPGRVRRSSGCLAAAL